MQDTLPMLDMRPARYRRMSPPRSVSPTVIHWRPFDGRTFAHGFACGADVVGAVYVASLSAVTCRDCIAASREKER